MLVFSALSSLMILLALNLISEKISSNFVLVLSRWATYVCCAGADICLDDFLIGKQALVFRDLC